MSPSEFLAFQKANTKCFSSLKAKKSSYSDADKIRSAELPVISIEENNFESVNIQSSLKKSPIETTADSKNSKSGSESDSESKARGISMKESPTVIDIPESIGEAVGTDQSHSQRLTAAEVQSPMKSVTLYPFVLDELDTDYYGERKDHTNCGMLLALKFHV